jgi:hypothetical protein
MDGSRGTAFHFGGGYVMTCAHVLQSTDKVAGAILDFTGASLRLPAIPGGRLVAGFVLDHDWPAVIESNPDIALLRVGHWCEDAGAERRDGEDAGVVIIVTVVPCRLSRL